MRIITKDDGWSCSSSAGVRFGDTNLNGRFMFLLRKRKLFNYLIPSGRASMHALNAVIQTLRCRRVLLPSRLGTLRGDYRILTVTSARIQLRFLAAERRLHNFLREPPQRRRNFRVAIMQIKRSLK